jgi:hypothetical protein
LFKFRADPKFIKYFSWSFLAVFCRFNLKSESNFDQKIVIS